MATARTSSLVFQVFLVLGILLGVPAASAQSVNSLRIVVAGVAGSPPDVISRIVATELYESQNWRIIVENRPGALSTLAIADVLKQPADGRTIMTMDVPVVAAPALAPDRHLRLETDFSPVIKLSKDYSVLVVNPSVPAKSLAELIALLKSQPGKFNFSSGPFGTPAHLIGEMFKLRTGVVATHVPYPGALQQRLSDLMGGITQFDFMTASNAVDLIATGRLRAIAVTAPRRVALLKDVPTVVEQGFPELVVEGWAGFAVKTGTPNEMIARLNAAVNTALAKEKVQHAFANFGAEPVGGTAAEFGAFVSSQIAHWGTVVRESGIKMPR
jgi:tripartite-type tricarboxylate transporter receptor subunit TctC